MAGFDTTLDRLITRIREQAKAGHESLNNTGEPRSENLGSEETPAPAYSDSEGTTQHFEPDQARTSYSAAVRGEPGSNEVKTLLAAKLQTSLLATLEREYKSRRNSRVRRVAHEASRRARQADKRGPVQAYLRLPIQATLGRTEVGTDSD